MTNADDGRRRPSGVVTDAWQSLRRHTSARIALGRAGGSLPTVALLAFQADHARARDAVHRPLDVAATAAAIGDLPCLRVHSAASDRACFLRRPDLGRRLDPASTARLQSLAGAPVDAAFVIADGLSAVAAERHAAPVLRLAAAALTRRGWRLAPVLIAEQARVALGDDAGARLAAAQVVMLIGERPGLSAADSLGIYLTHAPRVGRIDAERNCISNVRPGGLDYVQAAHRLVFLMLEARRRQLTGVALKDESDGLPLLVDAEAAD